MLGQSVHLELELIFLERLPLTPVLMRSWKILPFSPAIEWFHMCSWPRNEN